MRRKSFVWLKEYNLYLTTLPDPYTGCLEKFEVNKEGSLLCLWRLESENSKRMVKLYYEMLMTCNILHIY